MVASIKDSIPAIFFKTETPRKFGCPDCTDGCGLYLEVKQDSSEYIFAIDRQIGELTGEVKTFAQYLIAKLQKLRDSKS